MVNRPVLPTDLERPPVSTDMPKRPMISIRWTLPILIVTPLVAGIVLTGWLAFRSGRNAVESLISDLSAEVAGKIEKEVNNYLSHPSIHSEAILAEIKNGNLRLDDTRKLGEDFLQLTQSPLLTNNLYYGNEQGEFVYAAQESSQSRIDIRDASTNFFRVRHATDSLGKLADPVGDPNPNYEPRERPWYTQAKAQEQPTWSNVYPAASQPELTLTRTTPIFVDGQLQGVLGIDIYLSELSDFLRNIDMNPSARVFIIEPTGHLIATSSTENPFVEKNNNKERLPAASSNDKLVQATAEHLLATVGDLNQINTKHEFEFTLDNAKQLAYAYRLEALGVEWLIVVAIPQAAYMAPLNANARQTMFIGIGISGIASLMGLAVALWIVRPIQRIHQAAHAIKANTFKEHALAPVIGRPDEFGQLAELFNDMAIVVVSREQSLAEQVESLRSEIDQYGNAANNRSTEKINYKELLRRSQALRAVLKRQQE